jgi:hypothetical protein
LFALARDSCLEGLGVPETGEASVGFPYGVGETTTPPLNLLPEEADWGATGLRHLAHSSLALFPSFPSSVCFTIAC